MNYNKAIVLGNLTRDPEVKSLPSGQSVANFGIATNRVYTDQSGAKQQTTEFHNIVAFGKVADICSRYLHKGDIALIEGRIQTRSWVDQTGVKKFRTEIVTENLQLGPKRQGNGQFANNNQSGSNSQTNSSINEEVPIIDSDEIYGSPEKTNHTNNEDDREIETKNIPF